MDSVWSWVVTFYGIQIAAFLVLLWLSWSFYDRRYRRTRSSNKLENGFKPTAELFIDPKDGKTYRVYYNEKTGEREYIEEKS